MKITIIGAGYVGLSLAMLLSSDNEVTIVDKDEKKIKMINDGVSPLRESDIIKAFAENKDSIIATSSIKDTLINANLIIIAVSTDFNIELNQFELHNVESIINVAYQVNNNATIVIKSTIPVGFTNEICKKIMIHPTYCIVQSFLEKASRSMIIYIRVELLLERKLAILEMLKKHLHLQMY